MLGRLQVDENYQDAEVRMFIKDEYHFMISNKRLTDIAECVFLA